ncbi:MAG TPA: hypothetical protein GX529_00245 [Firmicutes bacterium]|nr:hypothetical protein [Candidatus Fermentithermobacillaceae bacterium]
MSDELAETKKFESTVEKIRDVIACRVVLGKDDEIEEVHVLASSGRSPRHIVRDVESAILAACGVRIDRRKISIAQINQDEDARDKGRPMLVKVALAAGKGEAEVAVEIALGDVLVSGKAKGVPTPNRWLWLAAEATLDALCKLLPPKAKIVLNDVGVAQSKSAKVALVTLTLLEDGQEIILSGSCPVKYDERESVVKATLDAVNRKFPMLLDN